MPTPPAPQALTVPDVLAGLQCPKHLWWRLHEPDASELVPDPARRLRAETELAVSALARERFPGGELIGLRHQGAPARLAATDAALARGRPVFHAASSAGGVVAAIDVLEPAADGSVAVVEVAAATEASTDAVRSAAVQAWVLERAGHRVREVSVLHLDPACRHPELDGLFRRTDVTARTAALRGALPETLDAMRRTVAGPRPDAVPGAHCTSPTPCPFLPRCRPAGAARRPAPTAPAHAHVHARPVAYLVLRTVAPAIPRWPGCGPFEPVPVQLSCHFERPAGLGGGHRHVEWLADGDGDPRPACAAALLEACASAATIVVDDRDAVRTALAHLRAAVPERAAALAELETRCVAGVPPASARGADGSSLEGDGAESWELHRLLFGRGLLDVQEQHMLRETRLADAARRSWALASGRRVVRVM